MSKAGTVTLLVIAAWAWAVAGWPALQRADAQPPRLPEEDPLVVVAGQMREARALIGNHDSGPVTQRLHREIISDLDRLLEQARKRCAQCKPGSKPPPATSRSPVGRPKPKQGKKAGNKPATTSNVKAGQGQAGRPDMEQVRPMMERLWGDLPPRERERMLQLSADEKFLPKYEVLIEEYFRRLTQEKRTTNDRR